MVMTTFSNPGVQFATKKDIESIVGLLNRSYRGEPSKKGWTTEAGLIAGNTRANDTMVNEVLEKHGSVILKYTGSENQIIGCVNLQQHGNKLYLGMFSVDPEQQGGGIGKILLQAAEEYATALHCSAIYMTVISIRTELINWYKRHGYYATGEMKPFEEDGITGKHMQKLEFMVLEKSIPV